MNKEIKKHLKLFMIFAKFSLMSQMEYRMNFVAGVLVETGWMLIKLLYVIIIYRAGVQIGMLTPDHMLLFIGTYVLMTGFYMLYYGNFTGISEMVREGNLDLHMVKPISLQFVVTLRHLDFAFLVPNFIVGISMIVFGWSKAGLSCDFFSIAGFLFYFVCSNILAYSMFLIPNLLCFWTVEIGGMQESVAALWDFNNMPQMIYGKWIQRIGTFLIPIFVITNFPGLFVMGELTIGMKIWGIVLPILFFFIERAVWKKAIRNYSSASS